MTLTAAGLSALVVLSDALFNGPLSQSGVARQLASFGVLFMALLVLGGLLAAYRRSYGASIKPLLARGHDALHRFARRMMGETAIKVQHEPLATGERVALAAGIFLTALDVGLTALLLRDVFPEPPYRFDFLSVFGEPVVEWSFYVVVAAFKAVLELWFGMIDGLRERRHGKTSSWTAIRWFVLGGASAFDAVLAASRGMLLAEQGLDGAAVTVSNIVFIGFGIAVPWVAARTGSLLVSAADPVLARINPVRILGLLARMAIVAVVWSLATLLASPLLLAVAVLGLLTVVWFAVEEIVGLVLGQDVGAPPDALVLVERRAEVVDDEQPAMPMGPPTGPPTGLKRAEVTA